MVKVIPLATRLPSLLNCENLDKEPDDAEGAVDMRDATNRAHAVRGAISTLDGVAITGAEFWAMFGDSDMTREWVKTAHAKLTDILAALVVEGQDNA